MSQNKSYLQTAIERRTPAASRLSAPVVGWLELIPGELVRLL